MTTLIEVCYEQSRLEFFRKKLKKANNSLSWHINHQSKCETLEDKGCEISFYTDVVNMLEGLERIENE